MIQKSANKKKSQKQEKTVAKELGGRTVVASGALWGAKGDVRTEYLLLECKITKKKFFTVTNALWEKIRVEAIKDGMRIPVLAVSLEDGKKQFAVVDPSFPLSKEIIDTHFVGKLSPWVGSKRVSSLQEYDLFTLVTPLKNNPEEINFVRYLRLLPWSVFLEEMERIYG